MALSTVTIQMRRGNWEDFDMSKMRPGELAVVLANDPNVASGKSIYFATAAGYCKRLMTREDLMDEIHKALGEIEAQFLENINEALEIIQNNESLRITAEESRGSAENERVAAETARKEAEQKRASAEQARISSETKRTTAETVRSDAEAERISAEKTRSSQETVRKQNEENRISQEQKRQSNTSQAILNAENATYLANNATTSCKAVTERAENALQNQTQLNETLSEAAHLKQAVSEMKEDVESTSQQVQKDKTEIDEIIRNSLLEGAGEVLESVKAYYDRAEALYTSMYFECDGETPYLRAVTPVFIDGGTPQLRNVNEGIDFDGGTPLSRLLAT